MRYTTGVAAYVSSRGVPLVANRLNGRTPPKPAIQSQANVSGQVRGGLKTPIGNETRFTNVAILARELGVSGPAISYHLRKGKSEDEIRAYLRSDRSQAPNKPSPLPPPSPTPRTARSTRVSPIEEIEDIEGLVGEEMESFSAAERRQKIAMADEREILVAQRAGELIPKIQVQQQISGMIVRARDLIRRIGPEIQDKVAAETDPVKCGRLISEKADRVLEMLAEFGI